MSTTETIRVNVDPTNPGQFFACCGLLELADRLWSGAKGYFDRHQFCVATLGQFEELLHAVTNAQLSQLDPDNNTSSPIGIGEPLRPMRLDWWLDDRAGGKELKVWAGTMESVRIARAMQHAMRDKQFVSPDIFNAGTIAYDPGNAEKKVEPFYFDSRRGPNAHSRDVGFSPNDLQLTTTSFPAVEFLCLVGLQRCMPAKTNLARVFDYCTWQLPLPTSLLPAAVSGLLTRNPPRYRFENWYRTGQRKHKAFRSATSISEGE